MDIDEIYKVGQWLNFKAGTCFGDSKDHLGFLVAISDELAIAIAINATSNVEGVRNFANLRHINSSETIVVIEPGTPESAYHFSRETAFDCNRPSIVKKSELSVWLSIRKIEIAGYNTEVDEELLTKVKNGISKSPLVSQKYKNLID